MFAVIPTVLLGGPMAVLAMLFPTLFGGWRRWLALISVACTVSTLYLLQYWFGDALTDSWWGSPAALWLAMTLATLAGAVWAWRRHLARIQAGEAAAMPGKSELGVLVLLSLVGLGITAYCLLNGQSLLDPSVAPILVFGVGAWVATLHAFLARRTAQPDRPALATEVFMLTTMLFACTALGAVRQPGGQGRGGSVEAGEAVGGADLHTVRPGQLAWTFKAPDKGAIASSPLIVGDCIYVAAAHDSFFAPYGAVYCLDRATGKQLWAFSDDREMKPVSISSPCVAAGRLYIGEGYHQDARCKVYCLNAQTGEKIWDFQTGSHTESSPTVVNGKVYIGAGDDGLYCLDAATGKKIWNFTGLHVDASPVVAAGRVYAGSGVGDVYKDTQLFCLDVQTGEPVWRLSTDGLPAWPAPVVADRHVYFGIGNGRYDSSDRNPAGALLCVAAASGQEVWRYRVADGVLARPLVEGRYVYFGSRDGHVYCLERATGKLGWKRDLGAPVVAASALARCGCCGTATSLYILAGVPRSYGRLYCLGPNTGREYWALDLAGQSQTAPELFSSPAVVSRPNGQGENRRVYFGATLISTGRTPVVYCFEDQLESGG